MRRRIILLESSNPLEELLRPAFLKQTHQRRPKRLARVGRYLRHRGFRPVSLLDVAACHLLELQISGDVGGHEDVGELAVGHEEFRHEVDVPIVGSTVLLPWLRPFLIVAVLFEELRTVSFTMGL